MFEEVPVRGQIEPQRGRSDDVNIEVTQADPGGGADALQATAYDVQSVFGGVEQDASGLWHGEPASTREHAFALLAGDHLDRHDIMHALVKHALSTRS